jgi:lysophospholipase L1-like esterase
MDKPQKAAGLSRFFERVGLAVVSLLVFFLIVEVLTRLGYKVAYGFPFFAGDEYSELYAEHPYLYRVPRPGAQYDVYQVNSHGFRGHEFELPRPPGTFRILALGGSSTWDSNVSGNETTWPAQLETLLNERRGPGAPRFEVVNGGVPGYNSAEDLMNFIWRGVYVDPDAVLLYQGWNDYKPNRWPDFKPDYSNFRQRDHSLFQMLAGKSRFLYWFRRLLVRANSYRGEVHDTAGPEGRAAFQDNLRRIAVLARARGIQPVFATFALSVSEANLRDHADKLGNMSRMVETLTPQGVLDIHAQYNQAVKELAAELGAPWVDVDAGVPKDFEHFTDHCHFSDAGARRAAEVFADGILSQLDVPTTGGATR